MPRTRRVDCSSAGITRRRAGRGFVYLDPGGERVTDADALARIRQLAIPPAWQDVWICLEARGHIQATGIDDAGRKQYRYHDDWHARRASAKFDAMVSFAESLPALRRRVAKDIMRPELDAERVNACAVRLLDVGLFRIGSEGYADANGSYGLTTLRKSHVQLGADGIIFDFPAKSGQRRHQQVIDPQVYAIVKELRRRRGGGDELLAYKAGRRWADLKAEHVNTYIKTVAGDGFTAKDFRTWNATALCAVALAAHAAEVTTKASKKRVVRAAIGDVATFLGNTPTVCRNSYVDPRVIDRFDSGLTVAAAIVDHDVPAPDEPVSTQAITEPVRKAVLDLIDGNRHAPGVEKVL